MELLKHLRTFGVIVSLVGCVERGQPYQKHSSPLAKESFVEKSRTSPVEDKIFSLVAGEFDEKILADLAKEILTSFFLNDFEKTNDDSSARKLWRLNQELISLFDRGQTKRFNEYMRRYEWFLFQGCTEELNRCIYLNTFFKAKNLSDLLVRLAKQTNDVRSYYKYLKTAQMAKGRVFDPHLTQAILQRSREYLNTLKSGDFNEKKTFVQWISVTGKLILESKDQVLAKSLVEHLDLNDSRSIQILSENGFSKDISVGLLSLSGGLKSSTVDSYFKSAGSLKTVQRSLIQQSEMAKLLELEPIQKWDQLTYVLDRTFLGEITVDQGLALSKAFELGRSELIERITSVYKWRFLQALHFSTLKAKELFFDNKISDDEFLLNAIRSGDLVKPIWSEFVTRTNLFQKFALLSLANGGQEDSQVRALRTLFDNKFKNIKYMSVYPQMMALSYHMAKRNASVVVEWGPYNFKLESDKVIENVFTGFYEPWFSYAEDDKPLSTMEIVYAFDFALRSGVFEAFDVDPSDFIYKIVEQLSKRPLVNTRDFLRLLDQRTSTTEFERFKRICREVKTGQFHVDTSLSGFRLSPLLGDLNSVIFGSISSKNATSGSKNESEKIEQGLSIFDHTFSYVAEDVRVDLGNIHRVLKAMLTSYESYATLKYKGQSEERSKAARDQLEILENGRVQFFRRVLSLFRELESCYSELYRRDQETKIKLLRVEAGYYRQVYKDIQSARAGKLTLEGLKNKYKLAGLPDQFTGLDKVDLNGYTAYSPDGLIRNARFLMYGAKFDNETFEAVAPLSRVHFPNHMDPESPFLRQPDTDYIPFDVGADEFVARGLKALVAGQRGKYFATWYSLGSGRILSMTDRQHAAAVLYRLSDQDLINKICAEPGLCQAKDRLLDPMTLIRQHDSYLEFIRIDDEERKIMKNIGLYFKIEPLYFARRIADFSLDKMRISRIWGLYDLPMYLLSRDILGIIHELDEMSKWGSSDSGGIAKREKFKHMSYKELAKSYFEIRQHDAREGFFFRPTEKLDRMLDESVRAFVAGETERIDSFAKALYSHIEEMKKLPENRRPRADVNLEQSNSTEFLTPSIFDSYKADLNNFNDLTDNCFVPQEKGNCLSFR